MVVLGVMDRLGARRLGARRLGPDQSWLAQNGDRVMETIPRSLYRMEPVSAASRTVQRQA
ncbi:hypothetical protein GGQ10_000852 [Salinibacter ruber]|nr:hypothetical protein [Salinibacter ruber]